MPTFMVHKIALPDNTPVSLPLSRRNFCILLLFLLAAVLIYILMMRISPQLNSPIWSFLLVWGSSFVCYFGACIWILNTQAASGRWYWAELGLIFLGALLFRLMLAPLAPNLSSDAWRYLWDGRVSMHGYNPYLYAPLDKVLIPLRDSVFAHSNYTDAPTKYPPGAEIFYIGGYLLAPSSLLGLKALYIICDLVTCSALAMLLVFRKLDPRRFIIYAWCPLPIVEYAMQAHIDVVAIMFTVLAVACALSTWRGARVVAGIFLGIATLVKLYPIVLLLALVRRRDWGLLLACALTIGAGYLPFLLFSQGHPLTVIFALSDQSEAHRGVLQMVLFGVGQSLGMSTTLIRPVVSALTLMLAGLTFFIVLMQQIRGNIRIEMSSLILTAVLLSLYAHVFPWYACAFLPWIALLIEPLRTAQGIALAACWYFTFLIIFSYIPGLVAFSTPLNWAIYYSASFGVVLIGLACAMVVYRANHRPSLA